MIIDKSLQIASGQGSITSAGTYYGTNWVDLSETNGAQIIDGQPWMIVRVGTAFATGDSLTFSIVTSTAPATDAAGTGLGTTTVEITSPTILTASLTADTIVWKVKLPRKLNRRYLGVKIVAVASSAFTAGTLDIDMAVDVPADAVNP